MQFSRESIFVSAIRSLCNALFGVIGFCIAIILLVLFIGFGIAAKSKGGLDLPQKAKPVIAYDAEGNRDLLEDNSPVILRIDIQGIIGDVKLNAKNIIAKLNDSQTSVVKDRIKAILLYVNTPGGSAIDSDEIYRALMTYKKKHKIPIYAYVEGLCASGGMYVSSAADKILASPSSIIGSVGVIMGPNFNFYDLMGKMGVKAVTLTQGLDKDSLNPFREWKQDEAAPILPITKHFYERFVNIVTEARPQITKKELIDTYGAKIFPAPQAKEFGYIDDSDSDYSSALMALAKAAEIKEDQKVQVVELKIPINLFNDLFEGNSMISGKLRHYFEFPGSEMSHLSNQVLYLYQP